MSEAAVPAKGPARARLPWWGRGLGRVVQWGICEWVRLLGRRVRDEEFPWLAGPTGPPERVGAGFCADFARERGLEVRVNVPHTGLTPDFGSLGGPGFPIERLDPRVRGFYERTADYSLDAWSHWSGAFWPFGCVLISFVSRRIEQLNLPLFPLEISRGMSSEIIQLAEGETGERRHTLWLRK